MSTSLNLYATKVFEEHPTSLWPVDEEVGYINLGGSTFSSLSEWLVSRADPIPNMSLEVSLPNLPTHQHNSQVYSYQATGGLIAFDSPTFIQEQDVSFDMGSVAMGFYIYSPDRSVDVRAGISYTDDSGQQQVLRATRVDPVVNVPARSRKMWAFVSFTFELPDSFQDLNPFIELSYVDTGIDYQFAIFGVSFGQWAEEFHSVSPGVIPQDAPENFPVSGIKLVPAQPYGLQGNPGYYVVKDNSLLSKNSGMPLVFGTQNSTVIYPGDAVPSFILPGEGFLNKSGLYKKSTFEFWTNIQSNAVQDRRIFGPLNSLDGLYVDKHLLRLKVGDSSSSFPVGEWGRPMLISIRLGRENASLLVNGEEVLSILIDSSQYPEPDSDWLAFFAYEDVPIIQIESPAIYPYEVPAIVQKRRFVYGQGVQYPTSIKGLNHSSTVAFDHAMDGSSKNVRYPQTSSWSSGVSNNLQVGQTSLDLPQYPLPRVYISDDSLDWQESMSSIFDAQDPYFKIRPTEDFASANGYLYLDNLSFLSETPKAIFGAFESANSSDKQSLIILVKDSTSDTFEIYLESGKIRYSLNGSVFFDQDAPPAGNVFFAGFDSIKAQGFGGAVAAFLSSTQSFKLFIGGAPNTGTTFSGKILRVSICGKDNLTKFFGVFADNGLAAQITEGIENNALSQNATYTLLPTSSLSKFKLDIATQSSWQNYVPLSYFAKNVLNAQNKQYKSLDFLQFNIDYVKLDNYIGDDYDTSNMPVKTYIAFEYLNNGVSPQRNLVKKLTRGGVIKPGEEWLTTKYEVLNDTIIKFPLGVDKFSLALVIYIEVDSSGISTDNIRIRSLDISSRSFGNQPNQIKTMFGPGVVPYKRSGLYFEYKDVSPFSIAKESSPYLHLTKYKGARSRVPFTNAGIEGLSVPININKESFFKIDLFQLSMRYDEADFPISPVQLFEIETPNEYLRFYLVADSNTRKRGQVYAIDSRTSSLRSDIVFYVNGRATKRPIVSSKIWTTLSFSFLNTLDFSRSVGAFRVTSPILFDNLSYYHQSQEDEVQRFALRKWSAVRSGLDTTIDWENWKDDTWQEVLFLAQTDSELADAELVYKTFTGTNSFIFDSGSRLLVNNYRSSIYKDAVWTSSVITPV